jgi:hypothetical protein
VSKAASRAAHPATADRKRSQQPARAAAVGVVEEGKSAVLVTIASGGQLLDRRRIDLTGPEWPMHPHHHEGSLAVGRYLKPDRRPLPLADVVTLVDRVREAAERGAREELDALASAIYVPIVRIAIRECPPLPLTTEARIRDNRAQTYADSVMYRQSLAAAAEARGWTVRWYNRDRVFDAAARALQRENPAATPLGPRAETLAKADDIAAVLAAIGKSAGPPWQASHKLAAAAALASFEYS